MNRWTVTKDSIGPFLLGMTPDEIEHILSALPEPFEMIPEDWDGYEQGSCIRYFLKNSAAILLLYFDQKQRCVCISVDKNIALCYDVVLLDLPVFTTKAAALIDAPNEQNCCFYDSMEWQDATQYTFPQLGVSLWREMAFDPSTVENNTIQADDYDHLYFDFVRVYDPIYDELLGLTDLWSTERLASSTPPKPILPVSGRIGPLHLGMTPQQVQSTIEQFFSLEQTSDFSLGRMVKTSYQLSGGEITAWYVDGQAAGFLISQPLFLTAFPDASDRFQLPFSEEPTQMELAELCSNSLCVENGSRVLFPSFGICLDTEDGKITAVGLIHPQLERLIYLLG